MDRVLRVLISRQTSGSSATSAFSTGLIRRVTNAVTNSGKRSGGVVLMSLCGPLTSSAERRHASGTDKAGTSTLYDAHNIVQLQQARHSLIASSLLEHEESIFTPEVTSRQAVMQIEMQQRLAKQLNILSGLDSTFLADRTHHIRSSEASARLAIESAFIKSADAIRADSIRRARQAVVSKPMRVDTQFGANQAATMRRVTGSKAHRAVPMQGSSSSPPQSPTTGSTTGAAASRSTSSTTIS